MSPLIVYISCINKDGCFQSFDTYISSDFKASQPSVISVSIVIAIGSDAVYATQIELFTSIKGAISQLSLKTKAIVPRAVIPHFEEVSRKFMIRTIVVCSPIGVHMALPVDYIILGKFIGIVLASTNACMPNMGSFSRFKLWEMSVAKVVTVCNFTIIIPIKRRNPIHAVSIQRGNAVDANTVRPTEGSIETIRMKFIFTSADGKAQTSPRVA